MTQDRIEQIAQLILSNGHKQGCNLFCEKCDAETHCLTKLAKEIDALYQLKQGKEVKS